MSILDLDPIMRVPRQDVSVSVTIQNQSQPSPVTSLSGAPAVTGRAVPWGSASLLTSGGTEYCCRFSFETSGQYLMATT